MMGGSFFSHGFRLVGCPKGSSDVGWGPSGLVFNLHCTGVWLGFVSFFLFVGYVLFDREGE